MKTIPVSFGKKIPLYNCKVLKDGKPVKATVYKYDCKDSSDFYDFNNIKGFWYYKDSIAILIQKGYNQTKLGIEPEYNAYTIERKDSNKVLGMGVIHKKQQDHPSIEYIESEYKKRYNYVGSTLIASISKDILNQQCENLYVYLPLDEVMPFYNKLGFKKASYLEIKANKDEMSKMIDYAQNKTNSKIINIKA